MRGHYNAKGVDVNGANLVAPPGEYTLKVKKVFDLDRDGNPKVTKDGDPMVSVLCEIDTVGAYLGSTVWTNVVFMARNDDGSVKKGSGIALHFLKCIGEEWGEGGTDFEWDSDRWIGRTFKAKLKVGKDQNGNPKNEIAVLIDEEKPKNDDDEVPF